MSTRAWLWSTLARYVIRLDLAEWRHCDWRGLGWNLLRAYTSFNFDQSVWKMKSPRWAPNAHCSDKGLEPWVCLLLFLVAWEEGLYSFFTSTAKDRSNLKFPWQRGGTLNFSIPPAAKKQNRDQPLKCIHYSKFSLMALSTLYSFFDSRCPAPPTVLRALLFITAAASKSKSWEGIWFVSHFFAHCASKKKQTCKNCTWNMC